VPVVLVIPAVLMIGAVLLERLERAFVPPPESTRDGDGSTV
jgi:hypothetical protein